jgi:enamine deaminase RidA (YjgF/YER057c/UK114 family)
MTMIESYDTGISHHIGAYADAVRVPAGYATVHLSGTPGLRADGSVPESFDDEARQAWENVRTALRAAGADLADVISVRSWLTRPDDIAAYSAVRKEFITHEPVFMLGVVSQLVWPQLSVEVEVTAAIR